jgi:micrococcal nuclease
MQNLLFCICGKFPVYSLCKISCFVFVVNFLFTHKINHKSLFKLITILNWMNKRKEIALLAFFIILFLVINYHFLDTKVIEFLDESDSGIVERVIDGDTLVINNTSVRLLGINTPEKKEFYYQEAKDFLLNLTLNKTVKLKYGKDKQDLYGRTLAYIILDEKNVNIEQVRNGFANLYIYDRDEYTNRLKEAWNECILEEKNLCEKSTDKCASCIELKELNVKNQTIIFYNKCDFDCNLNKWSIKDEGRKKFIFPNFVIESRKETRIIVGNKTSDKNTLYWTGEDYVWTTEGDTLFLRDENGKLVLWKEINR